MAFSPDGKSFVTGTRGGGEEEDGAHIWATPAALDDVGEMERRTWVTLATRLSERGAAEAIPAAEWNAMRAELEGATEDAAHQ